jgi:hypothetical protein
MGENVETCERATCRRGGQTGGGQPCRSDPTVH